MILIALTGGIGSGKSTVAGALAAKGAVILDADAIVRDLQQPGRPVFEAMVERWGSAIVDGCGQLDRQGVAAIVFNDKAELEALEQLIHPRVRQEMTDRIAELATTDSIVVQDVPLLEKVMGDRRSVASTLVVDCPVDVAISRLMEYRGFSRDDAEARIAAQISREERVALADFVLDNGGDLEQLDAEIERCWRWIADLPDTVWE
jgi:dephospho-CoA kinase